MGTLSFLVPELNEPRRIALERSGIATGYERSPVPVQRTLGLDELKLRKDSSDSGYLMGIWPLEGLGEQAILSATLRDRAEPYFLITELIRGRLNHLRNQIADWESIGFQLKAQDQQTVRVLVQQLSSLIHEPNQPNLADHGTTLLTKIYHLSESITQTFAQQLLQTRLLEQGPVTTELGCRLAQRPTAEELPVLRSNFNTVRLVPNWAAIEPVESEYAWQPFDELVDWALTESFAVSIGPIIDLAHGPFPKWFEQWSGDLPSLAAFTCDYLETLIRRYRDRVKYWQVFSGFNHTDSLALTEDDRLRLAARLLEAARQVEPQGEWVVGLTQPWGDYLSSEAYTYSPIVFADTLQRAGLNLAAIELEILAGPDRRASMPRDILEYYRLLELFNYMGIPIEVTLGDGWPNSQPRLESRAVLALSLPNIRGIFAEAWSRADAIRVPNTEYLRTPSTYWMANLLGQLSPINTERIE